jgi:NAD(P)-dependent dehydrogenase (short-subunit alcohol dehydrogenase family)
MAAISAFMASAAVSHGMTASSSRGFAKDSKRSETEMTEAIAERRVVLITGASRGIGRLCAEKLAAEGWRVFGAARTSASLDNVEMIEMNVDDDASVIAGLAHVLGRAGRLDALINNAGFSMRGAVEDVSMAEAKAIFETNFFGALRVSRAATQALRDSRGIVVNMSSLAAQIGLPFTAHYCASKAALEALSESLRLELQPFGVRVVIVEPGDFKTEINVTRRISEATRQGLYAAAFEKFLSRRRAFEEKASTAEPVAMLVSRVLNMPEPELRYVVAMPSQRLLLLLKRYAPQRVYELLLRKVLHQ